MLGPHQQIDRAETVLLGEEIKHIRFAIHDRDRTYAVELVSELSALLQAAQPAGRYPAAATALRPVNLREHDAEVPPAANTKKNLQNLLDTIWPLFYIVSDQEGVMQRIGLSLIALVLFASSAFSQFDTATVLGTIKGPRRSGGSPVCRDARESRDWDLGGSIDGRGGQL